MNADSLQLDERQRAMLEVMHVKVWQPVPMPQATPLAIKKVAVDAYSVRAEGQKAPEKQPESRVEHRQTALSSSTNGVETMDWPTLAQTVANCRACTLCESRKNTVFGVGQAPAGPGLAPQVDWLIVGEAPGENEDQQGEPFVGQAGKLLDNMLRAIGLDRRNQVYIANVLKCRPPANRNPEPHELVQCAPYLQRQIELLQPKIILAMGRFAVNSMLQATVPDVHKLPLGKLRGQLHGFQSAGRTVPVVATYHPAYLLRNLPDKAKAWADLCLAMDAMRRGS